MIDLRMKNVSMMDSPEQEGWHTTVIGHHIFNSCFSDGSLSAMYDYMHIKINRFLHMFRPKTCKFDNRKLYYSVQKDDNYSKNVITPSIIK